MTTFTKPERLNGTQLMSEFKAANIKIKDEMTFIRDTSDGFIHLDIAVKDETKAAEIVAAHVGVDSFTGLTLADKLAAAGITLEELKAALLG